MAPRHLFGRVGVAALRAATLVACSDPGAVVPDATVTDVSTAEHAAAPDALADRTPVVDGIADVDETCTRDEDCAGGPYCAGMRYCGPGGRCAYILTRLQCQDGQRCTDDLCDEATRSCRFVPHPERCGAGTVCVAYQGCVAVDAGR